MAIALYARKSVDRGDNSISCETQIEFCKSMLKPDERGEELLLYIDNGCSGGNLDRQGFQSMLREIERGKVTKVITYRLDRISRSLSDFINILSIFRKNQVDFVSSQEAFDTSSPYGELIVKILAVFAEFERQSIIQRVTQAYDHRSSLGFYMGGRKPYGFDLEPTLINNIRTKKLVQIASEIEQIQYIYNAYSVGQISLGRILKNLIENGIEPLSGGSWTTAKLSAIIRNPIYVRADSKVYEYFQIRNANIISPPEAFDGIHGVQIYGKTKHAAGNQDWSDIKVIVMTHEGFIDSTTWIQCQHKLANNRQVGNAVSNKTSWLGGKIQCGLCGRTMTTIKGKTGSGEIRRYFACTGKTHTKKCKGPNTTIYAESLEDMVYVEIAKKLESLKGIKTGSQRNTSPEINELKNKLKALELSQNKIADILIDSSTNSDLLEIMNRKATELKSEKAKILSRLEELQNIELDVKQAVNLSKKWKTASFEEKRSVCAILINRIIIEENGNAEIVWNI